MVLWAVSGDTAVARLSGNPNTPAAEKRNCEGGCHVTGSLKAPTASPTNLGGTTLSVISDPANFQINATENINVPLVHARPVNVASTGNFFVEAFTTMSGATNGVISVVLRRVSGDTVFVRRIPFSGVPVPRGAADSIAQARAKVADVTGAEALGLASRIQARMPAVYDPVDTVLVGRDGTTWLALSGPLLKDVPG
jgi:hypothetical protein